MSRTLHVLPRRELTQCADAQPRESRRRSGQRALALFVAALMPAVAAIWTVPWFVTQDGPAHVYNAQILASSVRSGTAVAENAAWRDIYTVRWRPIPNWAGSIALAALVANVPAWMADRIMTTATLVGFAAAIFWLRWRVVGGRGSCAAALLSAVLAMNMAWLLGFTSFMLGACLFPITLGFWWPVRDQLGPARLAMLGALLTLGYFCHLVSLGLSLVGLAVLSVTAPVRDDGLSPWHQRFARLGRTCTSMIPVVLLGLWYLRIATHRAPMRPLWRNLADPWSARGWITQLKWADPLSLAVRDGLPFTDRQGWPFLVFAPAVWVAVALVLWAAGQIWSGPRTDPDRRGWLWLATILVIAGIVGPDSLGEAHGDYLPQRVVLLGLVALVPFLDIELSSLTGRTITAALALALTTQSAVIWDYAFYSDRTAGQIIRAKSAFGQGQRVVTALASTRSRFRANPLLHAENWLGVDTGNVIWNNYETLHYYFPVQYRSGLDRPGPDALEWVSLHEDPGDAVKRRLAWEQILNQHASAIDKVLVWKNDPALEAITARWFDEVEQLGDIQIFRRGPLTRK